MYITGTLMQPLDNNSRSTNSAVFPVSIAFKLQIRHHFLLLYILTPSQTND